MTLAEPIVVTVRVAQVLERLGIAYYVGGSLASSVHGIPRATQDVDLVADLRIKDVPGFVEALSEEFYIDAEMIRDAIRRRSCFNVIHLDTMFKIDVFVPVIAPWSEQEMSRRQRKIFSETPHFELVIATPEDIVLHKLYWYQLGHEVSERQWLDVQGVLKVQGRQIDLPYLRRWAPSLSVERLLLRALQEAGLAGVE